MSVRVRFAPSPTGYLHVGGARTALFNWLLARKTQGTFILRIEDTDLERSSQEMSEGIIQAMSWMGLDWDEGPFRQSEQLDSYRTIARKLVDRGQAYYCFCSPEELARKRQEDKASRTDWKYDRTCLGIDPGEVERRLGAGETAAVRFLVPEGVVRFEDAVFGVIQKRSDELEDFVLVRSNGQPTYQLSVVADDADMRISHVVRGADHISNTPKQLLLYHALGVTPPEFAHVPLILGPDKSRLSKRHGATSVLAYRDEGIPPEAFINFLALLGWSDGSDRELFDRRDLTEMFSLDGISRSNAVFDSDKLSWFSGQYINVLGVQGLVTRLRPIMVASHTWEDRFAGEDAHWFRDVIELIRPRFRSLNSLAGEVETYSGNRVEYEQKAIDKFLKDPKLVEYLPNLAERFNDLEPFDLESTELSLRGFAEELGVKAGLLINASRVALTGKAVAPGIFEVMVMLGKDKTVERLTRVATVVPA